MTTDLRAALHDAASEAPLEERDLRAVVTAGTRRIRRRRQLGAVAVAVTAVAVTAITVAVTGSDRADPVPEPLHLVRLDPDHVEDQNLDTLASVRTTNRGDDIDFDRFDGVTDDGLVVRVRYTHEDLSYDVGLFDPTEGTTSWLPPLPPMQPEQAVSLTRRRLILFGNGPAALEASLAVFDRRTETWTRSVLELPAGLEAHVPLRVALAPGHRVYLGSGLENEAGPIHWWSFPFPAGGEARPEPGLEGHAVAWNGARGVTATNNGRVEVLDPQGSRVVSDRRPPGCDRSSREEEVGGLAPLAMLAGEHPVVTFYCGDELRPTTLVYAPDGGEAVEVEGAIAHVADSRRVLLGGRWSRSDGESAAGLLLLDLDRRTLTRVAGKFAEPQFGLSGGLLLWNEVGPLDSHRVSDRVWKVARLPRS